MVSFSQDWFGLRVQSAWDQLFDSLEWKGKPNLQFLEIGCFEGRATYWLLTNVLTHPTTSIEVIDTFEGGPEFPQHNINTVDILGRFLANMPREVVTHIGHSFEKLCQLNLCGRQYDMIYIDASHRSSDVLSDAVLSWPLLKNAGILIFDDTRWQFKLSSGETLDPGKGTRAFMSAFNGQFETVLDPVMDASEQVALRKL